MGIGRACALDMALRDMHTCEDHPERFGRWIEFTRGLLDASL